MKTNGLYLVAHYPDPDTFHEAALEGLKRFQFLEIGIPFSDPVADGPVIADAAHCVLRNGFSLSGVMESTALLRREAGSDKKIYFMTYANVVYNRGIDTFARMCRGAGVNGLIIPDVPWAESGPFRKALRRHALEYIHFVTPENTSEQIISIARNAVGFLYFIAIRGITGGSLTLDRVTMSKIALARTHSKVPVVLGFGVRDRSGIATAERSADGFIMGTRFIEALREGGLNGFRNVIKEIFR